MSLKLKIKIKEEKNSIVINELTGKHRGDNKGGWGVPNYALGMVAKAQFEIYPPESTNPTIIPCFPDFPSDDDDLGYEVSKTQLGINEITSGVWKVGYRVSGIDHNNVGFEKYTETKAIFIKDAECCVDKLVASTANTPLKVFMKDEKKKIAVELSALLKDAAFAKKCSDFETAQTILKYINLQCRCCS